MQEFGDPFFLNPNNSTQKRGVGFEANQTNKILFASLVYKIHQVIALRGKTCSAAIHYKLFLKMLPEDN